MRSSALPTLATAILLGALLVGAPLACGAVHRPTVFVALGLSAAVAVAGAWLATRIRARCSTTAALALPLFFLLVAALQSIPLPAGLRAAVDPRGTALLDLAGLKGSQPLSLDPPETWLELAKAAAALCVTLAGMLLASGRRLRFAAAGLVASAGLAAIVIGLGHRAFDENKIFGILQTGGGLLVGPFVNPNHSAEFLELAAFAALAFAFSRSSRDGQRVGKIAAAALAAGAISTLSRGSIFALGAGAFTWFLLAPRSDDGEPFHRSRFVAFLLALAVLVGFVIGLGGDRIVDEFRGGGDTLSKFDLSKDALRVFAAHPAGIGFGAFGHVYPIYQTLPPTGWFQFVENQPVGILIEAGIAGALALVVISGLVIRRFWKSARRDRIEASLVAGLVAVLAHNVVDFGLETFGVLLPFCALLGMVFGRQATPIEDTTSRSRSPIFFGGAAAACVGVAIFLLSRPAAVDFDALLKPPLAASSLPVAHAASIAHPAFYHYALAEARLEPRADNESIRARLRLLNRAMLLCPHCMGAHEEAARELWRLGRRPQSLLEWKILVTESRGALAPVLGTLVGAGAKPEELATLADDQNRFAVSRFLLAHGWTAMAKATLGQAGKQDDVELQLVRAQIAFAEKDQAAARQASKRALELAPRDSRVVLLAADVASADGKSGDAVLAVLKDGLRYAPGDIELNRRVLGVLMSTDKWQAIDQALAAFREALAAAGASTFEANLAAAQIFERRGQYRRAMSEYQAALGHDAENIGIRLALARTAEQSGAVANAIDAYTDVLRRAPSNQEAKAALARIQLDKKNIEVNAILPPHTGEEAK